MTNHSTGHKAEQVAAQYLEQRGYLVHELNWRTPACEIDIVAKKGGAVYFVEVKYRRTSRQGSGLDYITPAKLKQMKFAAQCWVSENKYQGDYEISALELSADYKITNFIETLT